MNKKLLIPLFLMNNLFAFNQSYLNINQLTNKVTPDGKWVGGFFANWSYWRLPVGQVKQLISSPKASFVTYAFLTMVTSDNLHKDEITYGGKTITEPGPIGTVVDIDYIAEPNVATDNINSLINYKATSQGKTLLMASIGGWSYSPRYTTFAKDVQKNPNALNIFAKSVLTWLKAHPNFDGINIDWEYPGWGQDETIDNHLGEGVVFNQMIDKIHYELSTEEAKTGKHYYISIATVASTKKYLGDNNTINWQTIAAEVDWIDLMAFDINGEFNAPNGTALSQVSTLSDLEVILNDYIKVGIPSSHILLGVPLYAREMLVKDLPTQSNQYGYNGSLNYPGIDKNLYTPDITYLNPPNVLPYYPATGMVDNTGVYSYSCFINLLPGGESSAPSCPGPVSSIPDNRSLWGAPLPQNLQFVSNVDNNGNSWIYGTSQNVIADPSGAKTYLAYPVFTLETKESLTLKINNLVKKLNLGGVWFWDLTQDSLNNPSMSLFVSAYNQLNK